MNQSRKIRPADEILNHALRVQAGDKTAIQQTQWSHGEFPPSPLLREKPPAAPFPIDALGPLSDAARAIEDMTQAPSALAAQSVLGVASLAVQGFADVQLHHSGSARGPLNLFLLTICESGERKSGCDKLAMGPVRSFEAKLQSDRQSEMQSFQNQQAVFMERRKNILRNLKSTDAAVQAKRDLDALGPEPEPPLSPSIVASDPTIEGVIKNLHCMHPSLGLFSDEAGAFIGGYAMNKDNALKTAAKLSKFWDGAAIDRWRAEDGSSLFLGRRLCCHLMAQEIASASFLADPVMNGQGLLARFLIVQPASTIGFRLRDSFCASSVTALSRFHLRISDILHADLPLAENTRNQLEPRLLELSGDAKDRLKAFAQDIEKSQQPDGTLEGLRAFASKSAEHTARLAGIMTLYADLRSTSVEGPTMENAITLVRYYINEAERLTGGAGLTRDIINAEKLRLWLINKWPHDHVSATDALQRGPLKRGFSASDIRALLEVLQAHDWIVKENRGAIIDGQKRREAWRIRRAKD
ncbi:YfjI family protein [Hirschia baltica]|uniref:DUF3987 domain-containing protein n=1 Tax=Hirschia baltica (strain ATCC 49814 / DSM 5838 / IFAM 1418) TaxID=582402 RepID=C6XJN5_HIRBI|nr:YfjI family protein [Hirschia baltica]ACT59330.1 conserved hypothetical protein [Hirschia baltica ATCC 49814]